MTSPLLSLRQVRLSLLAVGLLLSLGAGLLCAQATNTPAAAEPISFGEYLATHQDEVSSFFARNGSAMVKELVPVVLLLFSRILFLSLLAGWAVNVLLGRCYSAFFAPVYAKLKHALVYATGELIINLLLLGALTVLIIAVPSLAQSALAIILIVIVFFLGGFAGQVAWVGYGFRTDVVTSALFYFCLAIVHGITLLLTTAPILGGFAPGAIVDYVDHSVTPRIQAELATARHDLATAQDQRTQATTEQSQLQSRIDQAVSAQADLQKQIEEKKNSEGYLLSRIVQVRARGKLADARQQMADLLTRFPSGPLTEQVRGELADIDRDIATQAAQKKQADADAARAAAAARADLVARAGRGEVTLSEMRKALIGKNLVEIKELFGLPTEVGPNRWGFGQRMILDPIANRKTGLALYFSDGIIQSVDYYYGTVPAK